jgi:hypothetical protein
MSIETASTQGRQIGRSVLAIVAALAANVVLSLAVDQFLHVIQVYPPWGVPMDEAGDNLLALSYRVVFGVLSGYIAARLAPHAPLRHAIILGVVGTVLSLLGLIAAMQADLGPVWYPAVLVVVALPCAWIGGKLYRQ